MRLLRLSTLYPEYVDAFYRGRPELAAQTYAEQQRQLDDDLGTWGCGWGRAFGALGYEWHEVNANAEPLQRAWARDHGRPPGAGGDGGDGWIEDIVAQQIAHYAPEVLYVDYFHRFDAAWIAGVRAANPGIRLVLGWSGGAFAQRNVLSACDIVLSCVPEAVAEYRAMGLASEHVLHGFAPEWNDGLDRARPPGIPLSFAGQIAPGFHDSRIRLLERIVRACELDLRCPAPREQPRLRNLALRTINAAGRLAVGTGVPRSMLARMPVIGSIAARPEQWAPPISAKLRAAARPPLFGRAMLQFLRDSRVTLNCHTGISRASASNMRLFEATGVGACLLTDAKDDLASHFEPEREVVTFASPGECVEKIRWLHDHPAEAAAIAAAGQRRTLNAHTFAQRVPAIDAIVRRALGTRNR
jgi:hypothetical protein